MIYLIQSAAYVDNFSTCKEDILKIGYCGEDSKKSRFSVYLTENPTMRVLYLIPGGTEQDERNLHYHFRDFKKPYGREWFTYSPEILGFFQSHTTKESLGELEQKIDKKKLLIENPEIEIWVKAIMKTVYVDLNPLNKPDIFNDLLEDFLVNYENLQDYIKSRFPDSYEEIEEVYKELTKSLSPEIQEYLGKFNSIPTFPDKIKYLQTLDADFLDSLLSQIPQKFRDYYEVFGFERMKALKYSESLIKQEWDRIMGNIQVKDKLQERIYQEFQVGQSYTKSFIKEKLREIYQELGYQETPKATRINDWFETKIATIIDKESGKRENGFKPVKKIKIV